MKTYTLKNDTGVINAFEIPNTFFSTSGIANFFTRCNGCEITKTRRLFSAEEEHVFFTFQSRKFVVWEPFGDNSRLHIGFVDSNVQAPDVMNSLMKIVELTPRFRILNFFK